MMFKLSLMLFMGLQFSFAQTHDSYFLNSTNHSSLHDQTMTSIQESSALETHFKCEKYTIGKIPSTMAGCELSTN